LREGGGGSADGVCMREVVVVRVASERGWQGVGHFRLAFVSDKGSRVCVVDLGCRGGSSVVVVTCVTSTKT
jgi:hypothetical protein